ncbi:MAG: phosphoribosylglycinamide formyltransferase [Nitrospirae bacterium]|nr:MAG: phosphoribosylglycinamide formyltransferase [Nitrospirota bacterium]
MSRTTPLPLGVLASGRGSNFAAILEAIEAGRCPAEVRILVSDKPGAACLGIAEAHGIPARVVEPAAFPDRESFDLAVADHLERAGVELVCLAGFMRIVTPAFLDRFPGRVINIHPALLPSFPGLHAQRQALEHGVKISGCTVHFVDEGVDTGPIILQRAVEVRDDDTEESLSARILEQEHQAYPEAIRLIATGQVPYGGRPRRREAV